MKYMASSVQEAASEFGIGGLRRHIFLCRGPRCSDFAHAEAVWKYLKNRLKELGLATGDTWVCRTKADCFRVCRDGPIALVYPEGTWYHQVDEAKMERIIQSHLVGGKPLSEEAFATNPLKESKV